MAAVGASSGGDSEAFTRCGANALPRSADMRSESQVALMESGKSLWFALFD